MTNRITTAMDDLMPKLRASLTTAFKAPELFDTVRLVVRESGPSIRMPQPDWPPDMDVLARPEGIPQFPLRMAREIELHPLEEGSIEDEITEFSRVTVGMLLMGIVQRLAADATKGAARCPDEAALIAEASRLGAPCRILAAPGPYARLKDVNNPHFSGKIRPLIGMSPLRSDQLLIFSLMSGGPWVELLEAEFVCDWHQTDNDTASVVVSRRLYLNNPGSAVLYRDSWHPWN